MIVRSRNFFMAVGFAFIMRMQSKRYSITEKMVKIFWRALWSGFPLQVLAPRTIHAAVGFSLQSLTQKIKNCVKPFPLLPLRSNFQVLFPFHPFAPRKKHFPGFFLRSVLFFRQHPLFHTSVVQF